MSSQDMEPDVPADETAEQQDATQEALGNLTMEDDPEGTVNPSDLAGTADDSDEDVR